jgi:hypothetical protein
MKIDKMGVLILMAHLIITMTIIILYTILIFTGHEDITLRTMIPVIIGYWFGSMGKSAIRNYNGEVKETKKGA